MILKGCAIALISVFVSVMLRELGVKNVRVFSAVCGAVILSLASEILLGTAEKIKELSKISGGVDIASDVLKIVGIGYIFGYCADTCTELGESGTANALTTLGRLEILGIALPYFKKIIDFGLSLVK